MAVSWKILLNVVEKSPFTLSKVVRQQLKRCVDKLSKSTYPSLAPLPFS